MKPIFQPTFADFRRVATIALAVLAIGASMAPEDAAAQYFDSEPAARPRRASRQAQVRRNRETKPVARRETASNSDAPAKQEPKVPKVAVIAAPPDAQVAVISLQSQRIQVHGPGGVIAESRVSTGQAGHRTPMGVFSIIQRHRYHESNIYSGAPMPFMQRVTWSGIAMHQGVVPGYPASHGCIRLPGEFASRLWGMGRMGMRVIIAPSDVKPQAIEHARLPAPVMTEVAANVLPQPVQTALAEGSVAGSEQRLLDPFKYAQSRKIKAATDSIAAEKAVKPAYDLARDKSAEANRLSDELRRLERKVADAGQKVAANTVATNSGTTIQPVSQTEQPPAEAPQAIAFKAAAHDLEMVRAELTAARNAERAKSDEAFEAAKAAREAEATAAQAAEAGKLSNVAMEPVSIFVSRKEGRVFLRQGFVPIHDEPITFTTPEQPLGTHVYTAMSAKDGGAALGWEVVSVPNTPPEIKARDEKPRKKGKGETEAAPKPQLPASTASGALDRFELPEATRKLVAERLWPGASLIVSDNGISGETGKGTDFVVLTK